MKTIRLPANMSMLQVDRHLAQASLRCIRFIPGRSPSTKEARPERQHFIIVADAK